MKRHKEVPNIPDLDKLESALERKSSRRRFLGLGLKTAAITSNDAR